MSGPLPTSPSPRAEPTVLRSLSSAVLLDRLGDVRLAREMRGAPMEWGGVLAQLIRLTGRWTVTVDAQGQTVGLPPTLRSASVEGDLFQSTHRTADLEIRQELVPLPSPPGALRAIHLRPTGNAPLPVVVTSSFEPYLLPVLVEGIRPIDVELETRPDELRARHRGFSLAYRWSVPPSRLYVDRASWRGGRRRGRIREVAFDHEVVAGPAATTELRFAIVGGLARDLDRAGVLEGWSLPSAPEVAQTLATVEHRWFAGTPRLSFPDAPDLEQAYGAARAALRRLYTEPGEGLTGLVAGYPWYAAIWCRDLAWMLPAVLWLGDADWVRASINSVLRFQATADLPLIGAEAGELPMQISPGPIFLFGTSDTTLYYPSLLLRLVRHAGDGALPPGAVAAVERAIAWGERRSDPTTGLLRNGGEVDALEGAEPTIARVRYGIDSPDTTIWDSTDRRDHAIDLQLLWCDALEAAGVLLAGRSRDLDLERWSATAARLRATIPSRYAWAEEGYLCDTIRAGEPVHRLRPNALRAVAAGVLTPAAALEVVRRASRTDLTTSWGVRTLSSTDRGYSPTAYHDGQVWSIATAWAAEAAWAVGDVARGLAYLRLIAGRIASEGGNANECYRGDRAEPFDSCFLLGFSVAPFLTVLFERLWGLAVDCRVPKLVVRPAFPPDWRSAAIEGLHVGAGSVSILLRDRHLEVGWTGSSPLSVVGPRGRCTVRPGTREVLPAA